MLLPSALPPRTEAATPPSSKERERERESLTSVSASATATATMTTTTATAKETTPDARPPLRPLLPPNLRAASVEAVEAAAESTMATPSTVESPIRLEHLSHTLRERGERVGRGRGEEGTGG